MTIPLLVAVATIAISFLKSSDPSNTTSPSRIASKSFTMTNGRFEYGVVIGMGLSIWIGSELRKRRILERARVAFFMWLNESKKDKNDNRDLSKPVNILDLSKKSPKTKEDGVLSLISTSWIRTSNLNTSVVTIPAGKEISVQVSNVVEFYYVLDGSGMYTLDGIERLITKGHGFVVDIGRNRGFASRMTCQLVLLRVTDDEPTPTVMRDQPSVTNAILAAGFEVVDSVTNSFRTKSIE